MDVDQTRGNDQTVDIDHLFKGLMIEQSDLGDQAVHDAYVRYRIYSTSWIDDPATPQQ